MHDWVAPGAFALPLPLHSSRHFPQRPHGSRIIPSSTNQGVEACSRRSKSLQNGDGDDRVHHGLSVFVERLLASPSILFVGEPTMLVFRTSETARRNRRWYGIGNICRGVALLAVPPILMLVYNFDSSRYLPLSVLCWLLGPFYLLQALWQLYRDFPGGRISCFLVANRRTLALKRGTQPTKYIKRKDCLGFHFADHCLVLNDRTIVSLIYVLHPQRSRFRSDFFEPLLAGWWGNGLQATQEVNRSEPSQHETVEVGLETPREGDRG